MWGEWKEDGIQGFDNHPLMGNIDLKELESYDDYSLVLHPEKTIFNLVSVNKILRNWNLIDDMTVYPIPLLCKEDKNELAITKVAVINPNGKNKDNAVKYLELLSEYVKERGQLGVAYANIKDYEGYYDYNSKLFRDIYEIHKNSIVRQPGIANDIYNDEVWAYQHGEIDLNEAIKSIVGKANAFWGE